MKIKSLTIQRSKWLRGAICPSLLTEDGKMCCLGFFAQKCKIHKTKLYDIGTPQDIEYAHKTELIKKIPQLLTKVVESDPMYDYCKYKNSDFTNAAIDINDDMEIIDEARESKLIKLFLKNGIKLNFVD